MFIFLYLCVYLYVGVFRCFFYTHLNVRPFLCVLRLCVCVSVPMSNRYVCKEASVSFQLSRKTLHLFELILISFECLHYSSKWLIHTSLTWVFSNLKNVHQNSSKAIHPLIKLPFQDRHWFFIDKIGQHVSFVYTQWRPTIKYSL